MSYKIRIERKALKFINQQPPAQKKRLLAAIHKLPDEGDRRRVEGTKGLLRLRVGNYRVIYTVDHNVLTVYVIDADNRGQIYKRY